LFVGSFGKITIWGVKIEDSKRDKKLVGPAKNQCAKIKGRYIVVAFTKLLDFS